jgi:hypothetical protein
MPKSVFNPSLISAELLLNLRKAMVGNAVANRNYSGQVRKLNDVVDILTPSAITVGDYTTSADINVQELDGTSQTLTVDQSKYFAFYAHDPERIADYVDAFQQEGAYALADAADQRIMGHYAEAGLSVAYDSTVASPDPLAMIREARRKMSVAKVPEQGRWMILSPYELEAVEEKLTGRATAAGDATVRAGFQGNLYGFDIFVSHNAAEVAGTPNVRHGLAGYGSSITFADAIVELERLRSESRFADLVRGLHVYGSKVVRPESLVDIQIQYA